MFEFDEKLLCYDNKLNALLEKKYDDTLATVLLYLNAGICNHDCIYCDKNFYDISKGSFGKEYLESLLDDMLELGADSLIILGEGGEPILDKNLCWLIDEANNRHISCGLYTNGSVINSASLESFNKLNFLRVSLDAGTNITHRIIHKYPQNRMDFENAFEIMKGVDKSKVSVGAAYIILEENIDEIFETWRKLDTIGANFLELKLPLLEDYEFPSVSSIDKQRIVEQIDKILERDNPKTKLVYNKHFEIFVRGMKELGNLTHKEKEPCYTCAFRAIVSPLGY